jgi:hypothetical protein
MGIEVAQKVNSDAIENGLSDERSTDKPLTDLAVNFFSLVLQVIINFRFNFAFGHPSSSIEPIYKV